MTDENRPDEIDREALERRADRARDRLAHTLAALDGKRQEITHEFTHPAEIVRFELRSHSAPFVTLGTAAALAIATGAIVRAVRARARARHPYRERWRAVARAWQHPERLAAYRSPPIAVTLGRKVLETAFTVAAVEVLRGVAKRMVASRLR